MNSQRDADSSSVTNITNDESLVTGVNIEPDANGVSASPPRSIRKRKRNEADTTPVKKETVIIKQEEIENIDPTVSEQVLTQTPAKTRRKPARKVKTEDGDIKVEPPTNWEEVYNLTKEMRKDLLAPVDTMGCERLYDTNARPEDQRFQTLISLMLSSQTKDTVTAVAIRRLQNELPGGLTLETILDVDPVILDEKIGKVGFHNTKTKHIKQAAIILRDQFNGDIPDTIEGLVSLPGVGPKMAHLTMSAAWGRTLGIGVDVHVHRITNLWGWHKTKMPEETRKSLESWLPHEKWHEINHLLVGFGQTRCLPVGRKCGECILAERRLCPGSVVKRQIKKEAKIEIKVENGIAVAEEQTVVKDESVTVGQLEETGLSPDIEDLAGERRTRQRARVASK